MSANCMCDEVGVVSKASGVKALGSALKKMSHSAVGFKVGLKSIKVE